LENELPAHLSYHNAAHTRYVLSKTAYLADREKIAEGERLLLYLASLYHDTGFLISNVQHELQSCKIARKDLATHGFQAHELDQICAAIMATTIPQQPDSILGAILADADLYYMGTDEYDFYATKLYHELCHFQPGFSQSAWLDMQIGFLQKHRYHTHYGKNYLEQIKQQHLDRLRAQAAS